MEAMMGCNSSVDVGMNSADVVFEFVRLDEQISKLEAACPGPRLATVEAWIEQLRAKRNALLGLEATYTLDEQQPQKGLSNGLMQKNANTFTHTKKLYNNTPTSTTLATTIQMNGGGRRQNRVGVAPVNDTAADTPSNDLANLALSLGVVDDVRKASTHEDFLGNLSESALHQSALHYCNEVLEHTKVRLKTLQETYAELNELYVKQDGIIAIISGGTYMTRLEESLDAQLEAARDVRDKLGSALEQWRLCGLLLHACARSATLALQQWHNLANARISSDKVHRALECRSTLQASLTSLECAQSVLPHVQIKHISNRQVVAVKHCSTYMLTDIADHARYEHTSKVFVAYEANVVQASKWLYETFNETLRKDFEEAEEAVERLAKTLRDHREDIFTASRS